MEFVVISGEKDSACRTVANRLRAHGYRYFSPELFFVDDFGDLHLDPSKSQQAIEWCAHHAEQEIEHHHDVVVQGIYFNSELMKKAESVGYNIVVIRCDEGLDDVLNAKVQSLVTIHEQNNPSLLRRLFG